MSKFRIILDDKYCIVDDNSRSYALTLIDGQKRKVDGKEVFSDLQVSWHGTVKDAVQSYIRKESLKEIKGDMTLGEFMAKYESLTNEILDRLTLRDRKGNPID